MDCITEITPLGNRPSKSTDTEKTTSDSIMAAGSWTLVWEGKSFPGKKL